MSDGHRGYPLGPGAGRLLVRTSRAGIGARAGHDLTIEVTRWHGEARADPADLAGAEATVTVEVDSFAVRTGSGGVKPLTDGDRAEIVRTLREKILDSARHPTIRFRSTGVEAADGTEAAAAAAGTAAAERSLAVAGELTIRGVTRPVTVRVRVDGDRLRGRATVRQTDFGIKPYSALFGALRLADDVEVEFDLTLPPGG